MRDGQDRWADLEVARDLHSKVLHEVRASVPGNRRGVRSREERAADVTRRVDAIASTGGCEPDAGLQADRYCDFCRTGEGVLVHIGDHQYSIPVREDAVRTGRSTSTTNVSPGMSVEFAIGDAMKTPWAAAEATRNASAIVLLRQNISGEAGIASPHRAQRDRVAI